MGATDWSLERVPARTLWHDEQKHALARASCPVESGRRCHVEASTSRGSPHPPAVGRGGTVTCNRGTLATGGSVNLKPAVRARARRDTTLNSTATVSACALDPNLANNTAGVDPIGAGFAGVGA